MEEKTMQFHYNFEIDPFFWSYGIWFFVCMGLAIIAAILSQVFLCLWIHRDAKNHGVDATLWTVLAFFTGCNRQETDENQMSALLPECRPEQPDLYQLRAAALTGQHPWV